MVRRDVVKEVERQVVDILRLKEMLDTLQCNPEEKDYTQCVLRKAVAYVEWKKRRDRLKYQLAFAFVTESDIDMKEMIEQMVKVIGIGDNEWVKAVGDALRFRSKLDGTIQVRKVDRIIDDSGMI